jgi:hypothetical protein
MDSLNPSLTGDFQRLRAIALATWLDSTPSAPPGMRRFRDLTLFPLLGDLHLVIACDSNASIGEKPNDSLPMPYSELGISALKVSLMEVLAVGAVPLMVVNALCMEMEPSGRKVIDTMRQELIRSGFDPDIMLTGSTEDNARTLQSGIGITVIGLAAEERLRAGRARPGDVVVCVGNPKGGVDLHYSEHDPDIASIRTVLSLLELAGVHELVPVGSRGVAYEAAELARSTGGAFRLDEPAPDVNLYGSAGASTAVVAALDPGAVKEVINALSLPVRRIGVID